MFIIECLPLGEIWMDLKLFTTFSDYVGKQKKQLNRKFEVKCMSHYKNVSFIILFCCTALKINWTGGEFPWSWLVVLEMFNTLVQKYIPYLLKCLVFFRRLLKLLTKNYNKILHCLRSTKIFSIVLLYTDVMLKDCIVFSISKMFIY